MGTKKTRALLLVDLQDPATGINPTRGLTTELTLTDHNVFLDDYIASVFFLDSDTTDEITESATKKFLSTAVQTIDGAKTFTSSPIFDLGAVFKETAGDVNTVSILGNSSLTSSYSIKLPADTPSVGEVMRVSSVLGGIATMEFSSAGGGTINSGTQNRLAVYSTGTTIGDTGFGTSSGTVVLLPSQTGKTFSIPSVTASTANFVMSEESQVINGDKDFQGLSNLKGFTLESSLSGKITFNATGAVIPYTLTFPTSQGAANSLMSNNAGTIAYIAATSPGTGNANGIEIDATNIRLHNATTTQPGIVSITSQSFNGEKTFNDGIILGTDSRTLRFTNGTFTTTYQVNPTSNQTFILPDTDGSTGQFLQTDGAGNLTFASPAGSGTINSGGTGRLAIYTSVGTTIDDQVNVGSGLVDVSIASQLGPRSYTIPDAGSSAEFVMSTGSSMIAGTKTFGDTVTVNPTTNQLVLGSGNTLTINALAPSASRIYSIQDAGANANFVMSEGAQTINGPKTFNDPISSTSGNFTNVSNQLSLGTGNILTINSVNSGGLRTYTIPDVGTTAEFAMTSGVQTFTSTKTFSSAIEITDTATALNLLSSGGSSAIISVASHAVTDRTYSIPDAGTNANFVLSEGNATIGGNKTFSGVTTFGGNINASAVNLVTDSVTGFILATAPTQRLGFFGATPVTRPGAVTASLTSLAQAGTFTPDYTIQALTNASPWGFATQDEAETVLSVIRNMQTQINELKLIISSLGLSA